MHKTTDTYSFIFIQFIKALLVVILTLSTIGVCAAIISMSFGRPIGDDYGSIATYHYTDNWLREAYMSLITTGRYGQSIVATSLYGALGNSIVTVLPIAILFWLLAIIYLYSQNILKRFVLSKIHVVIIATALSIVFTFLILFVNNNPLTTSLPSWASFQLFFWPSGIITYTLPLLLLATLTYIIFLSSIRNRLSDKVQLILFAVSVLFTSLFNEVQPALIIVFTASLFGLSFLKYYKALKKYRTILIATVSTGIVSMFALYFSPGRISRSQLLDKIGPSVEGSIIDSTVRNIGTLLDSLYFRPREILLLCAIGLIAALILRNVSSNKKKIIVALQQALPYTLLLAAFCAMSIVVSIVLVVIGYGYSAGIYHRAMLIAQMLYVLAFPLITFVAVSLALFKYGKRVQYTVTALTIIAGLALIISLPNYIGKLLVQVSSSVTYATTWDAQDTILRKASSNNIEETVYIDNPAVGIGDGFSLTCTGKYAKSTMWLNVQVWEYYGKKETKICANPKFEKKNE